MPYKDPEKRKECGRKSYHKCKTKQKNRDYRREYVENNKEQREKYKKEWRKTPRGKESTAIGNWKKRGIIFHDLKWLYGTYITRTHCDNCNCELTDGKPITETTRCLDHNHDITDDNNVRGIVCWNCNINIIK